MFEELAGALHMGLALWVHKDRTKYVDQLVDIERRRYAELSKSRDSEDPDLRQSDGYLDRLDFELCLLSRAWRSVAGSAQASAQSGTPGV